MTPEQKAREIIDKKLEQSGWIVQDRKQLNLFAGLGVAVREFPTSTGPVDYALFVEGTPLGIIEAKKDDAGEKITAVEGQSNRYVNSTFKWIKGDYRIRFVYEATGKLTRFTDYPNVIELLKYMMDNNIKAYIMVPEIGEFNLKPVETSAQDLYDLITQIKKDKQHSLKTYSVVLREMLDILYKE